jgi:hypothetical protein
VEYAITRFDLFKYYDFTCPFSFDPSTPQYGLVLVYVKKILHGKKIRLMLYFYRQNDGMCSDEFQNCNNDNGKYYNGTSCITRYIESLSIDIVVCIF